MDEKYLPAEEKVDSPIDPLKNEVKEVQGKQTSHKKSWLQEIKDFALIFLVTLAVFFTINTFFFENDIVNGNSMYPTLQNNERIIVNKISPQLGRDYRYGDIVTIDGNKLLNHVGDRYLVKRIIGLPGDHVQIKEDHVYINGTLLEETYISSDVITEQAGFFDDVTLSEEQYYVLGDNREHSGDSRYFGPVPRRALLGYVYFRFYPFSRIGQPR